MKERIFEGVDNLKRAAKEHKKTPEQKRREHRRRLADERDRKRHAEEVAERQRVRDAANSAVALAIIDAFGERLPDLRSALKGSDFVALSSWLDAPYGWELVGFDRIPRPAPGAN